MNDKKRKKKSTKSQILSDHKRVGKRFIPTLLQLDNFSPLKETSWIACRFPEILWIGIILKYHGITKGIKLAESLAKIANETNNKHQYAIFSSYSKLSNKHKHKLYKAIEDASILLLLQEALLPFYVLYPRFPMRFIFKDISKKVKDSKLFDLWHPEQKRLEEKKRS